MPSYSSCSGEMPFHLLLPLASQATISKGNKKKKWYKAILKHHAALKVALSMHYTPVPIAHTFILELSLLPAHADSNVVVYALASHCRPSNSHQAPGPHPIPYPNLSAPREMSGDKAAADAGTMHLHGIGLSQKWYRGSGSCHSCCCCCCWGQ